MGSTTPLNLTNKVFGRLLVLESRGYGISKSGLRHSLWLCRCDCGKEAVVKTSHLRRGGTQSCGCLRRERVTTHSMAKSPTHRSWSTMKVRCYRKAAINYERYGGRGITVCDRWLNSFINFLEDMGERPEGMTLDRKNNDKGYYKSNCRWATPEEQANNRRAHGRKIVSD